MQDVNSMKNFQADIWKKLGRVVVVFFLNKENKVFFSCFLQ